MFEALNNSSIWVFLEVFIALYLAEYLIIMGKGFVIEVNMFH